jgi:hypothetical protein
LFTCFQRRGINLLGTFWLQIRHFSALGPRLGAAKWMDSDRSKRRLQPALGTNRLEMCKAL